MSKLQRFKTLVVPNPSVSNRQQFQTPAVQNASVSKRLQIPIGLPLCQLELNFSSFNPVTVSFEGYRNGCKTVI